MTLLAALVLVLRHLAAMRATTGELKLLRESLMSTISEVSARLSDEVKRGDEHHAKLVNLINRQAR